MCKSEIEGCDDEILKIQEQFTIVNQPQASYCTLKCFSYFMNHFIKSFEAKEFPILDNTESL